jgi:hypothetical protein
MTLSMADEPSSPGRRSVRPLWASSARRTTSTQLAMPAFKFRELQREVRLPEEQVEAMHRLA